MSRGAPRPGLRRRAENVLSKGGAAHTTATKGKPSLADKRLLHELQVHQVELEMQNDELRRTQLALRESRDRYQQLYDFAPTAHLMLDRAGKILEANVSATALLGAERAELRGRQFATFMGSADADTFYRERLRATADGGRRSCEVVVQGTGRRPVPVQIDVLAAAGPTAGGAAFQLAMIDLTEVRTYQRKLQRMAFDATLAEQRERRRIAADLHDRIGQGLAAAHMKLASLPAARSRETQAALKDTMHLLQQCIDDTRTLTFELSPPVLYDLGLEAALSWLAEDLTRQLGLRVTLRRTSPVPKLDDDVAAVLFRCARELLVNVSKHAGVRQAAVTLGVAGGQLHLAVEDPGRGFARGGARLAGFGLFSVREQVGHLGGTFEITSRPRHGTRARIAVPIVPVPRRARRGRRPTR